MLLPIALGLDLPFFAEKPTKNKRLGLLYPPSPSPSARRIFPVHAAQQLYVFPHFRRLCALLREASMKSPFKKLRDFAVNKHSKPNDSSSLTLEEEFEDVTQGMQDVEEMRLQYEGLLTNAHMISGAAYDFSRSVQDMASYMMETFGQFVDGEIGNVFSMLAKVQFEISKFLDLFAAHVSKTIITPTEMMMGELQQVQAMKVLYDEKRGVLNFTQKDMLRQKAKSGKMEDTSQFELAKEEIKEDAQILNFRLQSLRQGQSRSLVTQAARYHSAQTHLFSNGLASVNAMEPVMRQLALEKNMDRSLSEGDVDNSVYLHDGNEEGEALKHGVESESLTSSPTTLLEPQTDATEGLEVDMFSRKVDPSSKSAPISASNYYKRQVSSRTQELAFESVGQKKLSMYALPAPSNVRGGATQLTGHEVDSSSKPSSGDSNPVHVRKRLAFLGRPIGDSKNLSSQETAGHIVAYEQNAKQRKSERTNEVDSKTMPSFSRSYSHSGPITSNRSPIRSNRQNINNSSSTSNHSERINSLYKSGPISRSPMPTLHGSKNVLLPPPVSPPQISELHKLPLPPSSPVSASFVAFSAPLGKNTPELPPPKSGSTSPLPPKPPSGLGARSLSIPGSSSRLPKSEQESTDDAHRGFSSPPLKPLVLPVTTSML